MTGEITLRGRVMPVGGIKEKVLAAHRLGIRHVLLPAENARDLEELPADVRAEMRLELVSTMDDVLAAALLPAEPGEGAVPANLLAAGGTPDVAARP